MKCPSCGTSLNTPHEMASHACPKDDSKYSIEAAAAESRRLARRRAMIQPTREKLASDAADAVQQLHDFWDGEVQSIVILIPKNGTTASWKASVVPNERLRQVLEAVIKTIPYAAPRGSN